ncbi:MAG: dicarboxylate/amino acid:cation symporter [Steroidobacteraceae bacterium]
MAGSTHQPVRLSWILAAMAAGVALGLLVDEGGRLLGLPLVAFGGFLGTAFLNLLKMLVVPLVLAMVIAGVAGMGTGRDLGRLGSLAILFYIATTGIAVMIALTTVNLIAPGIIDGHPAAELLALDMDAGAVGASVQSQAGRSITDILLGMIPVNIVEAAAGAKIVGLLIFGVLYGVFVTRLPERQRLLQTTFWEGVSGVMMGMTGLVMRLAPLGVFGLTLKVAAEAGLGAAKPLLLFALCVLVGLLVYAFVALPLLIAASTRLNPWRIFPAMAPALLTAFSTSSSAATLPVTIECAQERAGVSPRIAGFVLPLGTSINHAGTALYECTAALFIAQAYGLHLSIPMQATIVLLALVTSMGIAGIPAAALVGLTVVLTAIGLPVEAVGVLLVVERLLDMARTAVNVLADAVATVIVARLSGETQVLTAR